MFKGEGKRFGLDVHFRSDFKNLFETDTLLAYVVLSVRLRALRCATDSFDVSSIEAIFIRIDDYLRGMKREGQESIFFRGCCFSVLIVFPVLYQLVYETGLCRVEICRKPDKRPVN